MHTTKCSLASCSIPT